MSFFPQENYANAASDATKGKVTNITITSYSTTLNNTNSPHIHYRSSSFSAIDVDAADIKALYRRCQALEKLGKLDMAFKDVQRCATLEPKNKTFLETLRRLGADIQAKVSITQINT